MVFLILLGLVAGILSSLLGIGGGILLVPGMMFLMDLPIKTAVGTSLAIIVPTVITGVFRHAVYGNVDWKLALLICLGAVTGAYLGALLSDYVPGDILKKIFAVFLLVMAVKMWRG